MKFTNFLTKHGRRSEANEPMRLWVWCHILAKTPNKPSVLVIPFSLPYMANFAVKDFFDALSRELVLLNSCDLKIFSLTPQPSYLKADSVVFLNRKHKVPVTDTNERLECVDKCSSEAEAPPDGTSFTSGDKMGVLQTRANTHVKGSSFFTDGETTETAFRYSGCCLHLTGPYRSCK